MDSVLQARDGRPDPDQLLRLAQAEEEYERRGRLKVFLGYSSGVGKSYRMFDEGRRRFERGQDVVVGAVQPRTPPDVQELLSCMQVIPLRNVDGITAMDLDAILRRHPKVCLVDGLAYDNPPGSRNSKRWEDVEELLDAGISVITSVNLQHIEETQPSVERITGKQVRDTIPKRFLMGADEIVIVDAPPDLTEEDASNPGRQQRLSQLRELALILAAEVVDHQLEQYLECNGIPFQWGTQERILVCITPKTNAAKIIESGRRNAERFHGELYVAHVEQPQLSKEDEAALDRNLAIARQAGARIKILDGEDPIDAIVKFARAEGVTQIFIGHSQRKSWWQRLAGSPVDDLIRAASGIDVRVFPH